MSTVSNFTRVDCEFIFCAITRLLMDSDRISEQEREFLSELSIMLEIDAEFANKAILFPPTTTALEVTAAQVTSPLTKQTTFEMLLSAAYVDGKYTKQERDTVRRIAKALLIGGNYVAAAEARCAKFDWKGKTIKFGLGVLGAALAVPLAAVAAPAVGGAIGVSAFGLSGAAASSSGLAFLGGGSIASGGFGMAGGTMLIQAALATLTGRQVHTAAGAYTDGLKDFEVRTIKAGRSEAAILFINGFLTEGNNNQSKWQNMLQQFDDSSVSEVCWDSKNRKKLAGYLNPSSDLATKALTGLAASARSNAGLVIGAALGPINAAHLAKNPWHVAMNNAKKCGMQLASWIEESGNAHNMVLLGHSLGARAIFHSLNALPPLVKVRDVCLFGGAVDTSPAAWQTARQAVIGNIRNFYSTNDRILSALFKVGSVGRERPIGISPIEGVEGVLNINVSDIVPNHGGYFEATDLLTRS